MTRARIETDHSRPAVLATALAADNTADVTTTVDNGQLVTTISRATTSSLEATVDDYIRNLGVAIDVVTHANDRGSSTDTQSTRSS